VEIVEEILKEVGVDSSDPKVYIKAESYLNEF
jgi:hypothetical protein